MRPLYRRMVAVVLAMLLMLTLVGCGEKNGGESSAEGSVSVVERADSEGGAVIYPGFTDRVLDWDHRTMTMSNNESNSVSFLFRVETQKGKVLFESEAVAPGESVSWDVLSSGLKSGRQKVCIYMTAVSPEGELLNTVGQTVNLTLPNM